MTLDELRSHGEEDGAKGPWHGLEYEFKLKHAQPKQEGLDCGRTRNHVKHKLQSERENSELHAGVHKYIFSFYSCAMFL